MILVALLLLLTLCVLLAVAARKGLEAALPFFAFMAVLSPLECSIPLPGMFDLTNQRLMLVALVGVYILSGNRNAGSPRVASTPLKVLIAIHITWVIVSTVNSVEPVTSLKMMLSMLLEYYVLYYILVHTISSTETIRNILYGMVVGIMVCCVFGAFEAYKGWSVLSYFPVRVHHFGSDILNMDEQRGLRVRSTFTHAILFGEATGMAIVWALYLLATAKRPKHKLLLWAGVMMMFLNIFKTSSRGPWSALALSFLLLILFTLHDIRKYVFVIVILSVLVCVIRPGVWDTIKGIYDSTFDQDSVVGSSYEYRWALLKVGEQALAKDGARQVWGYGLETFFDLHLEGDFLGVPNHKFDSCDSSWVELMVETGYVGLVLIAILLLNPLFMAVRDARKLPKPYGYLSWIFFISMLSFYYLMTNVAIYGWGQPGYMLWIVIAMSVVYPRLTKNRCWASAPAGAWSRDAESCESGVLVGAPGVGLAV